MVRDKVSVWDPFLDGLLSLSEKLEEFGIINADSQIFYVKSEADKVIASGFGEYSDCC